MTDEKSEKEHLLLWRKEIYYVCSIESVCSASLGNCGQVSKIQSRNKVLVGDYQLFLFLGNKSHVNQEQK